MIPKLTIACLFVIACATGCEKTTVEGPAGKKLTIVKPADVSVDRGSTEKVAIVVEKSNFTSPVRVTFDKLPKGVDVVDGGAEIEGNQRTFVLTAATSADLVRNHVATVTVSGPDGISATEQLEITVNERRG